MLNRRHIRTKVMQSIFEMQLTKNEDLNSSYQKLQTSCDNMYDLYLLQYQLFVVILNKAKALNTTTQKSFLSENKKGHIHRLANNVYLNHIASNKELAMLIEDKKMAVLNINDKGERLEVKEKSLSNWELDDEYATIFLKEILSSSFYLEYAAQESSFEKDKELVLKIFKKIIAPNDKLYAYYEDTCISWLDDLPLVNTMILKELKRMTLDSPIKLAKLFKDEEDATFGKELLSKVTLNNEELTEYVTKKTPKWDTERIASSDVVILKMAICELLKFSSIPVKVTINEYLEITKEYSAKKSGAFVNGVLDSLVKDFTKSGALQKRGRGLL